MRHHGVDAFALVLVAGLSFGSISSRADPGPAASNNRQGVSAPAPRSDSDASAPDAPKNDAQEARKHFARGLDLYGEGKYDAARAELERAYGLAPNYRLLYNLGLCCMQQGDNVEAIRKLEEYLKQGAGEIEGPRRAEVERDLDNLRKRVAYITVRTNVPDAELVVDDQPSGKITSEPVMLNPGQRKIWATKPGYQPASDVLQIRASEKREVVLDLAELPKIDSKAPSRVYRLLPWSALAVGVVLAGFVAAAMRRKKRMTLAAKVAPRITAFAQPDAGPEGPDAEPTPEHVQPIVYDADAAAEPPGRARALVAQIGAKTDVGRVKPSNQDSHFVDAKKGVLVVADGIGGYAGGEVASATAVRVVADCFRSGIADVGRLTHLPRPAAELATTLYAANKEIRRQAAADWNIADMGTTCVAARLCLDQELLYIAHIGDSRAYRLRHGKLEQMTTDHTMGQLGLTGKRSGHLCRALGTEPCPKIDLIVTRPRAHDVYLLCCDGLTKMVPDEELAQSLLAARTPDEAAADLVALANDHGGHDNITAVVARILPA